MNLSQWQGVTGVASGIVYVIAFAPYCISILRGRTKPSRTTWAIGSLLNILTLFSSISLGARNTLWMLAVSSTGAVTVFLLSLWYGKRGNRLDWLLLSAAVVVALVWVLTGLPLIAQLAGLVLIVLAAIPTILIALREPERESRLTWSLFIFSCILNLLSIKRWTIGIAVGPVVLFLVDATIASLLLTGPLRLRRIPLH